MWCHPCLSFRAITARISTSLCLIPVEHIPLVVFLSPFLFLLSLFWCESRFFFPLWCLCPALRIHNHTVLPSSHNSSYVYTNDSGYTNISAKVGEDRSLPISLTSICILSNLSLIQCTAGRFLGLFIVYQTYFLQIVCV